MPGILAAGKATRDEHRSAMATTDPRNLDQLGRDDRTNAAKKVLWASCPQN
ncbi:MAG TPA: hypothetical protein VNZ25_02200 [Candidatus Angelobacter sp.]|nr:hypothetical protein [Candidatus Angelobacter sp.]